LRKWHARLVPPPKPCGEDATVQELREEVQRLRRQLRRAELEREILKKVAPGKVWERGKCHDCMN
jgi:transposase